MSSQGAVRSGSAKPGNRTVSTGSRTDKGSRPYGHDNGPYGKDRGPYGEQLGVRERYRTVVIGSRMVEAYGVWCGVWLCRWTSVSAPILSELDIMQNT